ncbi:MAG: tyrosine-protein phosphatase [Chloroflexota bacterium]
MQAGARQLNWEGCYNARDLGGLVTEGGAVTRYGSVFRSDMLSRLTARGWETAVNAGLQTIIDLRGTAEAAKAAYESACPASVAYHNIPLESNDPHAAQPMQAAQTRANVYRVILTHYAPNVAQVMRAIAAAPAGGLVVHCHAGKDRTGIITALLLRLVGVSHIAIGADYVLSQAALWPLYEQMVAEAGEGAFVNPWLRPVAMADMILQPLAELEQRHGSIAAYLQQAGITDAEITTLHQRLM